MRAAFSSRVRVGAFEVDLKAGELRAGDRKLRLQEQPFQILLMLVERSGGLVTREEIQKKLWPNDTVVEFDHSIHTAINKLRQAFGDSAEDPKYIETVARRGYRLIAPWSEWMPSPASPPLDVAAPPAQEPPASSLTGKKSLSLPRAGGAGWRGHGCGVQGGRPEAGPPGGLEVPAGGDWPAMRRLWSASSAKRGPLRRLTIPTSARSTSSASTKVGPSSSWHCWKGKRCGTR